MAEQIEEVPEVFTKFDIFVYYPGKPKPKEFGCAVGNGALTVAQMAQRYKDRGHFRGATKVEIKGIDGPPPEIQQLMEHRAQQRSKILPKFLGLSKKGDKAEELLEPLRDGDAPDTTNTDSVGPVKSPKSK